MIFTYRQIVAIILKALYTHLIYPLLLMQACKTQQHWNGRIIVLINKIKKLDAIIISPHLIAKSDSAEQFFVYATCS